MVKRIALVLAVAFALPACSGKDEPMSDPGELSRAEADQQRTAAEADADVRAADIAAARGAPAEAPARR